MSDTNPSPWTQSARRQLLPFLTALAFAGAGCGGGDTQTKKDGGNDGSTLDGVRADGRDVPTARAATPTFAPPAGVYAEPQSVTIASATVGAQIRYTVDGTEPSALSPLYQAPVVVTNTTTIKAIAIDPTAVLQSSIVASATYTFSGRVPPPVFSIPSGTYNAAQVVTITDTVQSATIYYTIDGTNPTAASAVYSMPVTIGTTSTLKAIAVAAGMLDSSVTTAQYVIQLVQTAATPTFTPAGGSYTGAQDVTIATTTAGAQIYYTIDGTEPSQTSALYQAPVHIANTLTLKAKAFATGFTPSATATANYAITAPAATAPTITPAGGTFKAAQAVTLATTEVGGQIIYTLDGSIPNATSGTMYTGPFTLAQNTTVNAVVAGVPGKATSAVATAVFKFEIELPIAFDKLTGAYHNDVSVTITSTTNGASTGAAICYTKDGSQPACGADGSCATGQSTAGNAVVVNGNVTATGTTITARACKAGLPAGPVVAQTYTMAAADVAFDPPGTDRLAIGSSVTMRSETVAAEIRYREDGVDPTCSTGTLYNGTPIVLDRSKRYRAIACKTNYSASAVTGATYGLKLTLPVALQKNTAGDRVGVGSAATVSKTIDDLVFALGASVAAVSGQTLCYSVDGTAPVCTAAGGCDTSVTGLFQRPLQAAAAADPVFGVISGVVGDNKPTTNAAIVAPTDGSATLSVKAAFCAPNYAISDVATVAYSFKVAKPTFSRADATTTLATENAANTITTASAGATLRYYKIGAGVAAPTLSCTGTVTAPVVEVAANTVAITVNGGDSVAAIGCMANYEVSDTATANYPLPGATSAPVFNTQATTEFDNDIAAGSIKITVADIANVGDTQNTPAGVVCWTIADQGVVDCNEDAAAPTCVAPPAPGGTYTWNSTATTPVSNVAAIGATGVTLKAIACAPGKKKSTVTSQTFSFRVGGAEGVKITLPPLATTTTIGIGESITFTTSTVGATFRYTTGSTVAPPADPSCSGTGQVGNSYTVAAGDATNGSLIVKAVGCKNQYTGTAVASTGPFTTFRGAAVEFAIPAGTFGDVFEANSSNEIQGPQSVHVGDATGLNRICVTNNGTVPICTSDGHCAGQGAAAADPAADIIGGANGLANGGTIDWSTFNSSGLTLQAQACYTGRANPPVTVSGPYNFRVAALTITNTTTEPNVSPFTKTQRVEFRVGNEAATNVNAVAAPAATTAGAVRLCYTTDGSAVVNGCVSTGAMTCVDMTAGGPASRTYTMYLDTTQTVNAKACKSIMAPSTATQAFTFTPYSRSLAMAGANDFAGFETSEGFTTSSGPMFYVTWDATNLYLGWQGCGINTTNATDATNFTLAYVGNPALDGVAVGTAFATGLGGARWQVKYTVGTATPQLRIRNFSTNVWDVVPAGGVTAVHGAGTKTTTCTSAADNPGDYVILRVPLASLATPKAVAIASGINIADSAHPDSANAYGWPFSTSVFDAPAASFSLTSWMPPTGPATCATSGLDGHAVCQVAP